MPTPAASMLRPVQYDRAPHDDRTRGAMTPQAPAPDESLEDLHEVDAERFYAAFQLALADPVHGAFLAPYELADFQHMRCFLAEDGKVGGAIKIVGGHQEAVSLFNRDGSRGAGLRMLRHLTAQGADRLDCIGDVLRRLYERAGYRVVQTIPWDDCYKPVAWEYHQYGRPDIYVMEYQS
jgi:hypothetical protein